MVTTKSAKPFVKDCSLCSIFIPSSVGQKEKRLETNVRSIMLVLYVRSPNDWRSCWSLFSSFWLHYWLVMPKGFRSRKKLIEVHKLMYRNQSHSRLSPSSYFSSNLLLFYILSYLTILSSWDRNCQWFSETLSENPFLI